MHHYSNSTSIIPPLQLDSMMGSHLIDPRPQLNYRGHEKTQYDSRFEMQMERQNRMLTQLLTVISKQEEREKEQHRLAMNQQLKELELNKIKTALELEKQKSQRYNQPQPQPEESTPSAKRGMSILEKTVMSIVLKKSSSKTKNPLIKDHQSPPQTLHLINEDNEGDKDSVNYEEEEEATPQKSRRRLVSRSGTNLRPTPILRSKKTTLQNLDPASSMDLQNGGESTLNTILIKDFSAMSGNRTLRSKKKVEFSDRQNEEVSIDYFGSRENVSIEKRKFRREKSGKSSRKVSDEEAEGSKILTVAVEKDYKKKKVQKRLGSFAWALVYSRVLYNERKKHMMNDKEEFDRNISSNMAQILEMSKKFIEDCAGKEITKMLSDGSQSYIFANLPSSQAKKSDKMCASLMAHFKVIFNKLIINVSNMPTELIQLFKNLTRENTFLQNDYFSLFEINRMKFGPFGTLREMSAQRVKLIIGGVFIMRVLIHFFIMRPWDGLSQKKTQFKTEKLLNIASILYNATMGVFKTSVPAYPNNQNFLSMDLKVKHKKNIQQAFDEPLPENTSKIEKDPTRESEIIAGFYGGHQLSCFFELHKKMTDELKQLIVGFLDAVNEKVQEV